MNRKARQELIGIGALVIGLFLGLTLLRLSLTGSWGEQLGSRLWRLLGAGSLLLPVLGIGWALAASSMVSPGGSPPGFSISMRSSKMAIRIGIPRWP